MGTRHEHGVAVILDALGQPEAHPAARRLIEAFGGEPAQVTERYIGAPALLSRRLRFASGGEIILHDGTVVSVLLHLVTAASGAGTADLAEWITGADNSATLQDLERCLAAKPHYSRSDARYFALNDRYAEFTFAEKRGGRAPEI